MTTEKLFTVCGTSKLAGELKVRFANDAMRVKILAKNGHEDICLIELPEPMDKLAAVNFIKSLPEFQGGEQQSAIDEYLDRYTDKPKAEKAPRAKKEKAPEAEPAVTLADEADDDKPIGFAELEAELGPALL